MKKKKALQVIIPMMTFQVQSSKAKKTSQKKVFHGKKWRNKLKKMIEGQLQEESEEMYNHLLTREELVVADDELMQLIVIIIDLLTNLNIEEI